MAEAAMANREDTSSKGDTSSRATEGDMDSRAMDLDLEWVVGTEVVVGSEGVDMEDGRRDLGVAWVRRVVPRWVWVADLLAACCFLMRWMVEGMEAMEAEMVVEMAVEMVVGTKLLMT
jgi:hypothetical protein